MEEKEVLFIYKAKISPLDEQVKKADIALVPIRVVNPYSKEMLSAILETLSNNQYKECHIILEDTLHKYLLMIDHPETPEKEAEEHALKLGDNLLNEFQEVLTKFKKTKMEIKIFRWNDMLALPQAKEQEKIIDERKTKNHYQNFLGRAILVSTGVFSTSKIDDDEYVLNRFDISIMHALFKKHIEEQILILRMYASRKEIYGFFSTFKNEDTFEPIVSTLKRTIDNPCNLIFYHLSLQKKQLSQKHAKSVGKFGVMSDSSQAPSSVNSQKPHEEKNVLST